MDWMYNGGVKIQKEDYLLGKKVDSQSLQNTDNDTILPPQICSSDNKFSQVDVTKKILEDPLVNIKKREIECTKKMRENPMRLKKQHNIKPKKQTIDDHQLDMILVSRLKSYEKAGLNLAKILSITKHKEKKKRKSKVKSSSEDDVQSDYDHRKSINKKKIHNFEHRGRRQNYKNTFEYRDHRRNESKNKSVRHRSVSSSDELDFSKKSKSANEYKHQRNDNQKYTTNHSKLKHKSISIDRDDNQQSNRKKKKNEHRRSVSEDKYEHRSDKNSKNKVYTNNNEDSKKKSVNIETDKTTKYNHREDKNKEEGHKDNKRYRSVSPDREQERIKQNHTSEYSKNKSTSNEQYRRSNSSDKEHKSKNLKDSRNMNDYYKKKNNRRSRSSENPPKIKKDKYTDKSSNESSSDNEQKETSTVKGQHSPESKLDNDFKNKINEYGLFIPKAYVKKVSSSPPPVKTKTSDSQPKPLPVMKKNLTEEEMERMRNEMIVEAKIRDMERSSNVKRYRRNDKKEQQQQKPYSKDFLIKQFSHAASQVTVERSIKSNANKLQKDNSFID